MLSMLRRLINGVLKPLRTSSINESMPVLPAYAPSFVAPLDQLAASYRLKLTQHILPYWLKTIDDTNGGFLLSDDAVKGRTRPNEKQLVSQARMTWTFSHVHLNGLADGDKYLEAAKHGYRFLVE